MHVGTPICCVMTTLFCTHHLFLSRPSFSGHDITFCLQPVFVSLPIFPVATGLFCVQLISVSRHKDLCRDIKTPFQLEVCCNIDSPYCNQVSSSIKHPLSRPKLLLQHLFCINKLFHVAKVSVAIEEGSIATDILPSVQHYVITQTILFPTDLHMFFPFSVATCCLLSRPTSIVNNYIIVLRQGFFGNYLEVCRDTKFSFAT